MGNSFTCPQRERDPAFYPKREGGGQGEKGAWGTGRPDPPPDKAWTGPTSNLLTLTSCASGAAFLVCRPGPIPLLHVMATGGAAAYTIIVPVWERRSRARGQEVPENSPHRFGYPFANLTAIATGLLCSVYTPPQAPLQVAFLVLSISALGLNGGGAVVRDRRLLPPAFKTLVPLGAIWAGAVVGQSVGAHLFLLHPLLMLTSMASLTVGIGIKRMELAKSGHLYCMAIGTGTMGLGLIAIVANKIAQGKKHMRTVHDWMGLATFALILYQMDGGLEVMAWGSPPHPLKEQMAPTHRAIGEVCLWMGMGSAILGWSHIFGNSIPTVLFMTGEALAGITANYTIPPPLAPKRQVKGG